MNEPPSHERPLHPSAESRAVAGLQGDWQRLHPLSPLVRTGRGVLAIVVVVLIPTATSRHGNLGSDLTHLAILVVFFVLGVITWLVTRWRVEGGVLRVDSGLFRRTSERFPLSQIQAIDTVRPGLARVFGVAELRIRLASGGGKAGRLAYLSNAEAETLRAHLLALSHGEAAATPPAPEQTLVTVAPARLFASILLTGGGLLLELAVVVLLILAVVAPAIEAAALSAGAAGMFGLAVSLFRRFNGDYRLAVSDAADGLHLRSGLVETSAETIPPGRIQAIRMVEPLAWRPFGWCRLEVDVASQKSKGRQDRNQSKAARALLPVGSQAQAALLLARVFRGLPEERSAPPPRARWKSPLRFRYLSGATNERYTVTTSGRLRRVTDWVPLAKVQSVRLVEGPVQRRLRLASVHLDTAGRRVHAVLRDRDRTEATQLLDELPDRCRRARRADMSPRDLGAERRERLRAARLYLVCDASPGAGELPDMLRAAVAGGIDIFQLRDKHLADGELTAVANATRALCERLGPPAPLLVVNDRPHVALDVGADGIHVGQDDMPVADVRALVGTDVLIGLSTHSPEQIDAVDASLVDYIGVGPIHATPTKPGRPAVGLDLIRYAAAHSPVPFFAIGGLDAENLAEALDAGARRVCVLRAIADAAEPERAARELREVIDTRPMDGSR